MKKTLNVVCPDYLCKDTLPYAADIFYHGNLTYFMPTGFTPSEWENVMEFPQYCAERNISLPQIIWEMQKKYFECSKQAVISSKILEPFGKKILKVLTSYPRDIAAISEARLEIKRNNKIMEKFLGIEIDFNFLTRELFSHVFLEVYLEGGFEYVRYYLETNFSNQEKMFELLAAVLVNRMYKVYNSGGINCIVYNHSCYPFLLEIFEKKEENKVSFDSDSIDSSAYRLFTEIITPIFGRCDSVQKSEYISQVVERDEEAILGLKNICKEIVETSIFYANDKIDLRDKKLKELVMEKVLEPLSCMMLKPKKDVKKILTDFILDSTVIGGILSISQGFDAGTVGVSAAAGIVSVGLKYILSEEKGKKNLPEKFLLEELKKNKLDYLQYEKEMQQISFSQIKV